MKPSVPDSLSYTWLFYTPIQLFHIDEIFSGWIWPFWITQEVAIISAKDQMVNILDWDPYSLWATNQVCRGSPKAAVNNWWGCALLKLYLQEQTVGQVGLCCGLLFANPSYKWSILFWFPILSHTTSAMLSTFYWFTSQVSTLSVLQSKLWIKWMKQVPIRACQNNIRMAII